MIDAADLELLRKACHNGRPPVPSSSMRLALDLLSDEDSDQQAVIDELHVDAHLHFGLLSLANLPLFAGQRSIKSAHQAITLLGRQKCADILWMLALSDAIQNWGTQHPRVRDKLWRHSLLTGMLTHMLLQLIGSPSTINGLAAGMAHDIGHLLMVNPTPALGIFDHAELDRQHGGQPTQAPERDHCLLGKSLLAFWNAPPGLLAVALNHHAPANAEASFAPLVAGVRLADLVAEFIELDRTGSKLRLSSATVWQEILTIEPWHSVPDLDSRAIECLPEALLTTEHLFNLLGAY